MQNPLYFFLFITFEQKRGHVRFYIDEESTAPVLSTPTYIYSIIIGLSKPRSHPINTYNVCSILIPRKFKFRKDSRYRQYYYGHANKDIPRL